jgi:hypothetical protein
VRSGAGGRRSEEGSRGLGGGAKRFEDLVFGRIATGLVLREDELAVAVDIEDSGVSALERRLDAECGTDRGRQTGGPRKIVSTSAVGDLDAHVLASRRREYRAVR